MILLLNQKEGENNLKSILQRKFRRYNNIEITETGLDTDIIKILIDICLQPEFKNHKEKENNG